MTHADALSPAQLRSEDAASELDFDTVYAEHRGFVRNVLQRMDIPANGLDDATQDVFLVVHRRLHEFGGRARITTWLFRIAVNVGLTHRRRLAKARSYTPLEDCMPVTQATQHDAVQHSEMRAVFAALDPDKRRTLLLADLEQRTAPEIAALTGAPLNTVYARVRRARSAFAALWDAREQA